MPTTPNDQTVDQDILKRYQLVQKLGSGAYGHVWKVIDKQDKKQYALKKVYSAFQNDLDSERTFRQISILKKLDHKNIVKLRKVLKAMNNLDLYLVFDLVQSDLFKAIKGNFLNEVHKKYIIYQIAKTLKHIHSSGVIHRDIKPSNILIDTECKIKICDFGLSRTTYQYCTFVPVVITQFIATRWYRAPEVMLGSQCYTSKADIWSLGCLIYQMYAQKALLPGKDNIDQIEKLLQFKGFPSEEQKISLKVNSIDKILGHFSTQQKVIGQYFTKIQDIKLKKLLLKIFQYDPQKRPSAQQILKHPFLQEFINYEPEPLCEQKIKLLQNENIKLTSQDYKRLIYQNFLQNQSTPQLKTQSPSPVQEKSYEFIKSNRRPTVQRTLKQKSSHSIKAQQSIIPVVSMTKIKHIKHNSLHKQKMTHKGDDQIIERKKQSVSLYGAQNPKKQKSIDKRHKRQGSQQINVIMRNSMDQSAVKHLNKQGIIKMKKRTVKNNTVHKQVEDKYEIQIKQKQMDKSYQKLKNPRQRQRNIAYNSLPISPEKSPQQTVKSRLSKQKSTIISKKKKSSQNKQNSNTDPTDFTKQQESKFSQNNKQTSLHQSSVYLSKPFNNKSLIYLSSPINKLPQLINNKRHLLKIHPFNQIKKNKQNQSHIFERISYANTNPQQDNKKLHKKSIARLYNKDMILIS